MSESLDPGVPVLAEKALEDRIGRDEPVLVLFYADWCPFCEAFLPKFRNARNGLPVDAAAANLSHPEDPRWEAHDIETIPTLVLFKGGEERSRLEATSGEGLHKDDLEGFVRKLES